MPAAEILVTPERLEEEAGNLTKSKADHDNSLAEMQNVVNGLLQYWRGEAQEAFANSFNNKKKTFEEFSLDLEKFVKFLQRFAEIMRSQERAKTLEAQTLA